MKTPGHSLLAVALSAAQRGGEVLRSHFGRLAAGELEEKSRNDWVSAADRESERVIASYLESAAPGFGILAEEGGSSGQSGVRWVLDPLDGTLNFIRGFPHFAVSLALVVDGELELGVIHDPMRSELFWATRGGGAYRDGRPIRVSSRQGLEGGLVTTGFPFRVHRQLDLYLSIFHEVFLRTAGIRRPGAAALDLAHTAAGIFDAFFEFRLSPWDIAAGTLLVREAGGTVTNVDGGSDVMSHGNIVAGASGTHGELLHLIQEHCREADLAHRCP